MAGPKQLKDVRLRFTSARKSGKQPDGLLQFQLNLFVRQHGIVNHGLNR